MQTQKPRNDGTQKGKEMMGPKSHKMKKNMQRLGGSSGLSLEAFANAKSKNNAYNPAILKKKREFYKNAKYVNKYKKLVKQHDQQRDPSSSVQSTMENNDGDAVDTHKKNRNKGSYSLNKLYEKKHEEEKKARMERETMFKAKKEEKERVEAKRKALREKMYKKTRKGQPVMKYRIEHILETLQGSTT